MKKNILNSLKLIIPFLGIMVFTISCSDIEDDDFFTEGGTVLFFQNVEPGFYDLGDLNNTFVGFDVGQGGDAISNSDYMIDYSGALGSHGPVSIGSSANPGNFTASLAEACTALGIDINGIEVGDNFNFTAITGTARRTINIKASCLSTLAGEYAFSTVDHFCEAGPETGTATITEVAAGVYTFDDWAFGTYQNCYGGPAAGWGTLQLSDLCNKLSILGLDNYDDTWSYTNVEVNGADLTLSWSNTYGEFGVTTLTRGDGTDWPPLTN